MGYFLLLYYDGDKNGMAPRWDEWDQEISNSLVDGGHAEPDPNLVTEDEAFKVRGQDVAGYRIIKASDFDEAVEISKGAPPLYKGGRAEVYQVQGAGA